MVARQSRARHHREPQSCTADARRDEGEHGGADSPLQALQRRNPRSGGRSVRRRRGAEGRIRRLRDLRWREQALSPQVPAARFCAPGGTRRDVAWSYDRRCGGDHRNAGYCVWIDRSMNTAVTRNESGVTLSADARAKIDREIAKYPPGQKRSAVMAALAVAQDAFGWLSTETMDAVAKYLDMPPVAVYEVASFYTMYNIEPTGRFKLTICTNLPCALQGATAAAAHLKRKLGIDFNETSADGLFTLKEGECFGACGDAPVVLVNNKRMECWMHADKLDALLSELIDRAATTK